MRIYLLEYCKEIEYEDFTIEDYNLIGIYLSESAAYKAKARVSEERDINKDQLFVSSTFTGRVQWEGGFISV